jgi:hypothetical protein
MASVRRLQPIIQERLDVMMQRIKDFKDTDKVLNASCMLAALGSGTKPGIQVTRAQADTSQ